MSNTIETVGFFGCGAMAEVVAAHMLPPGVNITGFDPQKMARLRGTEAQESGKIPLRSLGEVANADLVIFAVPAREIESAVVLLGEGSKRINDCKNPQLIMDISSVKEFPEGWFKRLVTDWGETLVTHPLFGPQSVCNNIAGKDIIVTSHEGEKAERMLEHWKNIGAQVTHMSAIEHDKQMVGVQALPFMVAHAFNGMGLTAAEIELSGLAPTSPLLTMANVAKNHSWPLTETLLGFNRHAQAASKQLRSAVHSLLRNNVVDTDLELLVGKAVATIPITATNFSTPTSQAFVKLVQKANASPDFAASHLGAHSPIASRFLASLFTVSRQFRSAQEMVEQEERIMDVFKN